MRHSKSEPGSLEVNSNLASVAAVVRDGPASIVVSGAVPSGGGASTVHDHWAGVASTRPASSTAATENECGPSASAEYVQGDPQGALGPPSRLHLKVAPGRVAPNSKVAEPDCVSGGGPEVISVSGGTSPGPSASRTNLATDGT